MPAKGLKYQASPIQKKKAELAERLTCSSFLSRFCRGMRPRTWGCAKVVASTPTTMTIAACRNALRDGCSGVGVEVGEVAMQLCIVQVREADCPTRFVQPGFLLRAAPA